MKRFNYVIDAPSVEILLDQIYDESQDVGSGDLVLVLMLLGMGEFLDDGWHWVLFLMSRTILYTSIDAAMATADHRILQCLVIGPLSGPSSCAHSLSSSYRLGTYSRYQERSTL